MCSVSNAPNPVVHWLNVTPADRAQARELAAIYRRAEQADVQTAAIGHVTKRAMVETAQTNALRQEAERLTPDAAELFAMIAIASAAEMAAVIAKMNRPGGYKA